MLVGCSGGPSSTVIAMSDSSSNRKEMVKLLASGKKKKNIEKLLLYKDISYKMYELLDNKDRKVDLKEGKKRCKTVLAAK